MVYNYSLYLKIIVLVTYNFGVYKYLSDFSGICGAGECI